jgi:hypothetical protein
MSKHPPWRVAALGALLIAIAQCGKTPTEPAPPCTFSLSTSSISVPAIGGSSSVSVTTAARCTWSAASDRGWMPITSGATGTGPGTVAIELTANPNEASRTGTLTIAGQTIAVLQDGQAPCAITISPTGGSYGKDGGTASFAVSAAAHCQWSAASAAAWVTVSAGTPGNGNGTVAYAVERNRDVADRVTTITVAGRTFTVNQAGDVPALNCEYSVTPVEITSCMSVPYTLTTSVSTQQGCTWTAAPGAGWITVVGGATGTGSGTISFTVTDNWDAPRLGNVMVRWPTPSAGQNVRVQQAGCTYAVSTTSVTMASAGGPGRFDVYQQSDPYTCGGPLQNACRWTAQSDVAWITVTTSMPQAGDNPVSFSVAANDSAAPRTGRITVRDKSVVITQAGR